jgi:hypothetical protein
MPYTRSGKTLINKATGKKRTFKSKGAAKRWERYVLAKEHGWKPSFSKMASRGKNR